MTPTYCIFDTEYTTWPDAMERHWNGEGQHRELTQIAATIVDPGMAWSDAKTFNVLVKPVMNPVLTTYASELTNIPQEKLERVGFGTAEALAQFSAFVGDLPCYSNGMDINVIAETCGLQKVIMPLEPRNFHSLSRPMYEALAKHFTFEKRDYPSGRVHLLPGIIPPTNLGHAHDALHDVWSLYVTLEWLKEQGDDVLVGLNT